MSKKWQVEIWAAIKITLGNFMKNVINNEHIVKRTLQTIYTFYLGERFFPLLLSVKNVLINCITLFHYKEPFVL